MNRIRELFQDYGLLALWIALVALAWQLLNHHQFNPKNDTFDAKMLFGAACIIFISVLIMLVETRAWSIRRVAVFGLICFDSGLYGLTGSATIWQWHVITQSDLNILRAVILVSAPLLLLSQIRFLSGGVRTRVIAHRATALPEPTVPVISEEVA